MLPPTLAFLGLGATEFALIVVIYILLFGADKAPDLARSLGRAQAQLAAWKRELDDSMEDARRQADFEFEIQRERQIRAQRAGHVEEARLRQAARDLGIPTEGRSPDELRAAIRERVGAPEGAGGGAVEGGGAGGARRASPEE